MKLNKQVSLQKNNSFNVKCSASLVYTLETIADLEQLPDLSFTPFYILGDGSNTLFVDTQAPVIIKPNFKGIDITESEDSYIVKVGAGENWHKLVSLCIERGIYGLENLALIPGSVGAAPVQNIGAYGAEFANFCHQVKWFELSSKSVKVLNRQDCQFAYRHSIFKGALYNKGIITEVVFNFPKNWQANLSYAGLNALGDNSNAKEVMAKVIHLRQRKLPDPKKLPNAGSFFKNPVVNKQKLLDLQIQFPNLPFYPQKNDQVKLAAGWLIEQAGLKGYKLRGVGVHEYQALVLVNYESDYGKDIVELADFVQHKIFQIFDILLYPEVRMITKEGERNFSDLPREIRGK